MTGPKFAALHERELTGLIDTLARQRGELVRVLTALVSDLEGLHAPIKDNEGDPSEHDAEREDYFGPFTCYYDEHEQWLCEGEGVRVCWPNARISLAQAKKLLEALA
ncbi:MAG TPA: hypothetical protein VMU92_07100 [Acidobacteriaceae bacterium]|nr:hypothetical protein [Acidobacteriaceae bacterium]